MRAVITADIIDYTKLNSKEANEVLNAIHTLNNTEGISRTNLNSKFSIKRGDNIQGEINNVADALRVALILKATVNKILFNKDSNRKPNVDVRIAIGIGEIETIRSTVGESTGEAYILSGRTLDKMKDDKRIFSIKASNEELNKELDVCFKLLEVIMNSWKITSFEVLYSKLMGIDEAELCKQLKVSQPAITGRKKSMGWSAIESLLNRFEILMQQN